MNNENRFSALCAHLALEIVDAEDLTARENAAEIAAARANLASLLAEFERAGGRGIDLADEIDAARWDLEDLEATILEADVHKGWCYGEGVTFGINGEEWAVLTDDEADRAFRESVESYVDECMDIPDHVRPYFDLDTFIRDCELSDGRGHSLAAWDGVEEYATVDGVDFYLYRQN